MKLEIPVLCEFVCGCSWRTFVLQAVHSVKQEVVFMTDEEKKDYVSDPPPK